MNVSSYWVFGFVGLSLLHTIRFVHNCQHYNVGHAGISGHFCVSVIFSINLCDIVDLYSN